MNTKKLIRETVWGKKLHPALTLQTDRHRMLHHLPGIGLTMDVHSRNELCFISLVTTASSLFLVRKGVMAVESDDGITSAAEGEFLLLQAGIPITVTHKPSEDGQHEATGLLWDRELIEKICVPPGMYLKTAALLLGERDDRFLTSFSAAYQALHEVDNLPEAIVAHRLQEILLWLGQESIFFRPAECSSAKSRLRNLLETNPGAAWAEKDVVKALGQSPATLRRHLAAEGTSYREVLGDTRMLHALRLLHSTDQSVGAVARNSGYACQSRFAQSFRKRFGFHPSVIRGHKRDSSGDEKDVLSARAANR